MNRPVTCDEWRGRLKKKKKKLTPLTRHVAVIESLVDRAGPEVVAHVLLATLPRAVLLAVQCCHLPESVGGHEFQAGVLPSPGIATSALGDADAGGRLAHVAGGDADGEVAVTPHVHCNRETVQAPLIVWEQVNAMPLILFASRSRTPFQTLL